MKEESEHDLKDWQPPSLPELPAAPPPRHLQAFGSADEMPEDFIHHRGRKAPFAPRDIVETFVEQEIDGQRCFGVSLPTPARMIEWNRAKHPGGIGAVVGYKLVKRAPPELR